MKLYNIKYLFLLAMTTFIIVSCSDSDKIFDQIIEAEERGAVLRQTNVISNSVALNSDTGQLEDGEQFAVDLEYQDDADGSLFSELEVYLSFADNTDDGVDNTQAEVLHETIAASSFSDGDRGLPTLSYSLTALDMLSSLGLNVDQLGTGGDQFTVRFEIVLTDGRRFSAAQNSGTITGSYFSSPFANRVTVVCAPTMPTAGTWTVVTNDSYGDDWNGASLTIVLDGNEANAITIAHAAGPNTQMFEFTVPDGTSTIFINYNAGSFDEENSFTVTSANGNEVINQVPSPTAGVELLDFCAGGL